MLASVASTSKLAASQARSTFVFGLTAAGVSPRAAQSACSMSLKGT